MILNKSKSFKGDGRFRRLAPRRSATQRRQPDGCAEEEPEAVSTAKKPAAKAALPKANARKRKAS
jgi:hypothetical protein